MPISHDAHTVKQFDAQLANLRNLVLEMGGLVEDQIKNAVKSLDDEDLTLAREVIARDQIINGLQVKIDEDTITLIATRQPVGSDLRLIMSLSKAVTDLERIGDEAEKIARMTIKTYDVVSSPPSAKLLRDVTPMAKLATDMLHGCLDALARVDVEMAVNVARGDDNLDQEFQSALRRLITYMMEDPRTIVLFIIKALERIGDHAKNIAEYIIYLVKGKDVRHVSMDTLEKDALAE